MKAGLLGCLLFLVFVDARAHRLDEYLQATRVAVATNRIDLSFELTPGVAVVDQLLVVIDKNHDGQISTNEAAAYAQGVLDDIRLKLDEKSMTPSLVETSFPELREVRGGRGVIRIKATAPSEPLSVGNHTVVLTNAHLPAISVYLVNALVPQDSAIRITKQTRDELQTNYRLEFNVKSPTP